MSTVPATRSVALVEQFLAAATEGRRHDLPALLHDDFELVEPPSLPYGGTHTGVDGYVALLQQIGALFELRFEPDSITAAGDDTVVVRMRVTFTARSTGRSVTLRVVELLTVRDGRLARSEVFLEDTAALLATAAVPGRVRPRDPAPPLEVALLSGGTYVLSEQRPARFSLVVFFRGLHCPVCAGQLRELERGLDELEQRGVEVIAVSSETRERTQELHDAWRLDHLPLGYGLGEDQMRRWGLFVSRGIGDEPALFNEPGMFLIAPDGTVYYEALLSMPVGRPRLPDLLAGIDYWVGHGYPARGEA